jgi:argininosuccinate synthase
LRRKTAAAGARRVWRSRPRAVMHRRLFRHEGCAVKSVKKVVLAYSGGLDTSIILKWLQETYQCEVVTFTADLGQGEELEPARAKALKAGVKPENIFIEDLREEFVRDYVFPMFRANTLYEGQYLLGTSIARPLIAKKQIEIATRVGADAVAHGSTGKGNDQIRYELSYYALKPDVTVIAPWRVWDFAGRPELLAYARKHDIEIARGKEQDAPFSIDANLLHTSSEGLALEDPDQPAPDIVTRRPGRRTVTPEEAPDKATIVDVGFERGDAVSLDGARLSPAALLTALNALGGANGVGGLDLVENRYVGMKSRGYYETPGGTILWHAHRGVEQLTLDRGAMHLKDELMPKYAALIYNGMWFTPEREMLQAAIDKSQTYVTGNVRLKLYKGGVSMVSRSSPYSLYSKALVGFDAAGGYNQADAEGFIKLNALRLRIQAERDRRAGRNE